MRAVKKGVRFFEAERLKARADKRQKRKAKEKEAQDIEVQQLPVSADFVCQTCGRACKSRIDLYSLQPLQNPSTAALTSSKSMSPPPPLVHQSIGK